MAAITLGAAPRERKMRRMHAPEDTQHGTTEPDPLQRLAAELAEWRGITVEQAEQALCRAMDTRPLCPLGVSRD